MSDIFKDSDSCEAKFSQCALRNNRASTLTKKRMGTTFSALAKVAKNGRWGSVDPSNLTLKQWTKFVQVRLAADISSRALQNEMSHIRRALLGAGRTEFANLTNKQLGVPSASRIGTGLVVDPQVLAAALQMATPETKPGILLPRTLGLRQREFVRAKSSLPQWEKDLENGRPITVFEGAKNGRVRTVFIPPERVADALAAVRAAIQLVQAQGDLIVSVNLKAAIEQHGDRLRMVGLFDENSCHALRRAFAMDNFQYYLSIGISLKIALGRVSSDLGHGDGRGRWVFNNYLRATLKRKK